MQIFNVYQNLLRLTNEAITTDEDKINSIYNGIYSFSDDELKSTHFNAYFNVLIKSLLYFIFVSKFMSKVSYPSTFSLRYCTLLHILRFQLLHYKSFRWKS